MSVCLSIAQRKKEKQQHALRLEMVLPREFAGCCLEEKASEHWEIHCHLLSHLEQVFDNIVCILASAPHQKESEKAPSISGSIPSSAEKTSRLESIGGASRPRPSRPEASQAEAGVANGGGPSQCSDRAAGTSSSSRSVGAKAPQAPPPESSPAHPCTRKWGRSHSTRDQSRGNCSVSI